MSRIIRNSMMKILLTKLISISFANGTIFISPRIPNMRIKIFYIIALLLPNPKGDPGNLGTILRLAEWFGIENVVCSTDCVDVFNPKTVQSTMGTILRKVPLYTDIHEFITAERAAGIPVYVTALSGDNIYASGINRLSRAVFVMGSENNGVSPQIMSLATGALFIPPFPATCNTGRSESLNVAIATSILCYELRRP